ncbi:hypothetical protein ACH5RR_015148 [Cinchona calisaya]|uniref:DUF4218 domain-containing protein n=1 Tax=Cinchona calisaya TaxID=153742 RepID=A0ABD2ZSD3_9GENT
MHILKNTCESLLRTPLNIPSKTKDTDKAHEDLYDMGRRPELHLQVDGGRTIKPSALYVMSSNERKEFCEFLRSIKFPDGYAANISKCVKEEAKLGGPVHPRQMFPFERYLGSLKKYGRNRARLKGSIDEGFIANECLTFMSKYLHRLETRFNRKERNYDCNIEKSGELLVFSLCVRPYELVKSPTKLSQVELDVTHKFILNNCDEMEVYRTCTINEVRFHKRDRDDCRTTQNSGLIVKGDHRGKPIDFYGFVKGVIELTFFHAYNVVLFQCEWYNTSSTNTMKSDRHFIWKSGEEMMSGASSFADEVLQQNETSTVMIVVEDDELGFLKDKVLNLKLCKTILCIPILVIQGTWQITIIRTMKKMILVKKTICFFESSSSDENVNMDIESHSN